MSYHLQSHYVRHVCRLCGHTEASTRLAQVHAQQHLPKKPSSALINIGDVAIANEDLMKEMNEEVSTSNTPSPAYKCLECDMFFQTSKTRKAHVAKYHNRHSPSLECDLCNKLFANKYTLIRHLRLHEGPLPQKECPICQKLVRVIDLKYHVKRHQTKGRFECRDCKKVFSHISTYQGHLKYTRAHASDHVFK
ncbi:unnamed protein product [Parnassius apollo]|uniref:(apollo) hypothetical protein n=1 Tax=Parnassius apollo TaxID=110799 RepID=A0A8S3XL21_PARAO|nr:unnamed protein product [Parnassius apollo]